MVQALLKRRKDDAGFTLVELMIVILIIGILIAVGLPTFLGARERAQDRAAQSLLRNGMVAAKTYYTDKNAYTDFTVAGASGATPAAAIEPSITWVYAAGDLDQVGEVLAEEVSDGVTLTSLSGSGTTFCIMDIAGAASGNGTFYGMDPANAASASPCPTPVDPSAIAAWDKSA